MKLKIKLECEVEAASVEAAEEAAARLESAVQTAALVFDYKIDRLSSDVDWSDPCEA